MRVALKRFWDQRSPKSKRHLVQGVLLSTLAAAVAAGG